MLKFITLYSTIFFSISCTNVSKKGDSIIIKTETKKLTTIAEIPLPKGFERIQSDSNSFGFYLQHFKLNANNTVYYWDGTAKSNQSSHYAVLDISVGKKDLQQCADAIMRLRAEYFLPEKNMIKLSLKIAIMFSILGHC